MLVVKQMVLCKRDGVYVSGCPGWDKGTPEGKCNICAIEARQKRKNKSKKR